jgi:pimeloyl-ACP methyl ester carboxylesterase
LVFGGRASKVPLHVVQKIADSLPGSELVLFEVEEHGAHAMFFECPTKYNEAIRRFMAN